MELTFESNQHIYKQRQQEVHYMSILHVLIIIFFLLINELMSEDKAVEEEERKMNNYGAINPRIGFSFFF